MALVNFRSRRGKDLLLYLMFVVVAFVFWLFLSLDAEVQRDFRLPLQIEGIPDSVVVIGNMPQSVAVSVKGKESQLLKYTWGELSPLKFKFVEQTHGDFLQVTNSEFDSRIRDYFGGTVKVVNFRPDSIMLPFTASEPRMMPLIVVTDVTPGLQYALSGPVRANVDSVKVYALGGIPKHITSIRTETLVKTELKDTTRCVIKVKPVKGLRFIPDKVTVTIPVEPLISRTRQLPVEAINVPEGKHVATFPSTVEVSYLVPMSKYNAPSPINVIADYGKRGPSGKLGLELLNVPPIYRSPAINMDSVDYIIEDLHP